jgi:hypothetical protein
MLLCAMTTVLAGDTEALDRVTMVLLTMTIVLAGDAEALDRYAILLLYPRSLL